MSELDVGIAPNRVSDRPRGTGLSIKSKLAVQSAQISASNAKQREKYDREKSDKLRKSEAQLK